MKNSLISFILIFSVSVSASQDNIREGLKNILPDGAVIELIEPSPIPGIYAVYYGDLQPIYVTQDGSFFIYGDIYKININSISNITEKSVAERRKLILQNIPSEELISFKSSNEQFSVIVFTDVDCGYCRKLHNQIDEYNSLGISINYAAFPRSGIGTSAFTKMVGAWCSDNPKDSMTKLKNNSTLDISFCENQPVSKQYIIGKKLGVDGTPAIFSMDGEIFPGYIEPEELLLRLKS
ncbi:thioredoxin fold domain-containing protein [Gammaproteobacteria bacterium]|nr:thioredoxin fold domain-containing protein [Gammaproteobacteria bacterium]MDC0421147.1 thioredoxin fold domain-containing protein [Gammaproteobacteria bacterium]MDC0536276.1 thioredoxin fold domain-containing protein [Gammaproteobacteria bacterium]MDC1149826.1 thioredoxin fold domain-containing protein [Gammaproteobacteria bacterium]MDC1171182.1 thioredoxin fold domain-containing protein [Gammaproteobacteria bacterium]